MKNQYTADHDKDTDFLVPCLQIGKLLTSTLNLKEILEVIMSKISQLAAAENWSLLLVDQQRQELFFEVAVGIDPEAIKDVRIPLGKGIAGEVAKTGKPIYIPDAQNDPRFYRGVDKKTGFTTESIICLPLNTHGRVVGVIEIINVDDMEQFSRNKLPILTILADYAAIAIENSQYLSKIEKMSLTDEYTGLYNSRYLHQILPDILNEVDKKGGKISVVFMDIDNFKNVVDTYGHLSGSLVLKEIGQTIDGCLGEGEILIKYGGDEYVILMPGKNREEAFEVTRKIQKSIQASTYLRSESNPVKITASFGLAVYPDDASTKKDLLLSADGSMYKIKKSTKNGIGTSK